MENAEQTTGPKWAIVELMGHVRTGGLISKDAARIARTETGRAIAEPATWTFNHV